MPDPKRIDRSTVLPPEPPPPPNPAPSVYTQGDPVATRPDQLPKSKQDGGEVQAQGYRAVCGHINDVWVRYCPDGTAFGLLRGGQGINVERYSAGYAYGYAYGCVNAHGWVDQGSLC
jgi:hypothetical protein